LGSKKQKFALNIKKASYMPSIKCSIFCATTTTKLATTSRYYVVFFVIILNLAQDHPPLFIFIIVLFPSSWELYVSIFKIPFSKGLDPGSNMTSPTTVPFTFQTLRNMISDLKTPRKGGIPSEIILKCSFICQKAVSSKLQYSSILLVGLLCLSEMQFSTLMWSHKEFVASVVA
jgi:hypothetical protein